VEQSLLWRRKVLRAAWKAESSIEFSIIAAMDLGLDGVIKGSSIIAIRDSGLNGVIKGRVHGVPIFLLLCHICKAWLLEFLYIYLNKDNYRYVKLSDVLLYTGFKT
jgi:hypothetical protein